jgi:tRNA pseudouridine38/39 synthase
MVTFRYLIHRSGHQLIRSMKPSAANNHSYEHWTKEELIARLVDLDDRVRINNHNAKEPSSEIAPQKEFNFSAHRVRKIALKFCYSGWEYNGLTFQKGPTPLPTVEEVLFQAMANLRLVDPAKGFAGCGWERCGRTDRGVSAAGQVMSLWIRSAAADENDAVEPDHDVSQQFEDDIVPSDDVLEQAGTADGFPESSLLSSSKAPTRPRSEFHYVHLLNRMLPPTIRVLAWSPVSPSFSARFKCRQRHYKYFFSTEGLDLSLMRDGAQRLVGEHDFRNLCKVDPTKQITIFHRRIVRAEINPVAGERDLCVLDLVGTAFLYHQVRHIMAILFLIGTGLEHPSVVSSLLNVDPENLPSPLSTKEDDPPLEIVDRKPIYQMADALPLMLWDCMYTDADVQWRTTPDGETCNEKRGSGPELYDQLHSIHNRSTIHTVLDAHFLSATAVFYPRAPVYFPRNQTQIAPPPIIEVPLGGGTFHRTGNYTPLLRRKRMDSVEDLNARWRASRGERKFGIKQLDAVEDDADE